MRLTSAAGTDIGRVRSRNEDSYVMLSEHGVFIVADGVGGNAAGDIASEMAVRITSQTIGRLHGISDDEASARMRTAIQTANDAIFDRAVSERDKRGMATTATVLVLLEDRYLIGHVGDSRAYLLRGGQLRQLTTDHTYVQDLVDSGILSPERARDHRCRHIITRSVGAGLDVLPDVHVGALEHGDILLLASDGLTEMLEDEQLVRILSSDGEPQDWVDRMIAEANLRGGPDNITAIVVRSSSAGATHVGAEPAA